MREARGDGANAAPARLPVPPPSRPRNLPIHGQPVPVTPEPRRPRPGSHPRRVAAALPTGAHVAHRVMLARHFYAHQNVLVLALALQDVQLQIQRYTKTGIFVCVRTLFVTLPSTTADSPPR